MTRDIGIKKDWKVTWGSWRNGDKLFPFILTHDVLFTAVLMDLFTAVILDLFTVVILDLFTAIILDLTTRCRN